MERKLAAILAADVVGYGRLMGEDEVGTLAALKSHRRDLIEPKATQYNGRTVKLMGDGALMEFASVVDAVSFAIEVQVAMLARNRDLPEDKQIVYRVGINLGDIIHEGDDIYGDGVNVAARLEGLAEPGGVCLSRAARDQILGKLDLDLEDLGETEVKNIARPVGIFRVSLNEKAVALVTPITEDTAISYRRRWPVLAGALVLVLAVGGVFWWQIRAPDFEPASLDKMAFPLPDKPSIAVLPFANIGKDPEQEYFADAITNDLITDLSKFNHLFVIAANSTFTYKGKPVKAQQVAEDLGVRYVLEGSVQRASDTLRINTQLIDALSGHHLWAERYDRKADDLFAVQNEIIKTIVGTLQLEVKVAESERALKRPTDNLSAYDYFQLGFAHLRAWTKDDHIKARAMQQKAVELDPDYARAYTVLALTSVAEWLNDWAEDTSESPARAVEYARKAVALDPDDYWNLWALARIHNWLGEPDLAHSAYERALALNPHDPTMLMSMVELQVSLGQAEQAVAQAKTAIRYNPRHPEWYLWSLGWAQYFAGQHDEAVITLQRMTNPPNGVRRTLAAALVRLGRLEEASEVIEEFRKEEPDYTVAFLREKTKFKHRPYVDKWAEDLLKAGLPE